MFFRSTSLFFFSPSNARQVPYPGYAKDAIGARPQMNVSLPLPPGKSVALADGVVVHIRRAGLPPPRCVIFRTERARRPNTGALVLAKISHGRVISRPGCDVSTYTRSTYQTYHTLQFLTGSNSKLHSGVLRIDIYPVTPMSLTRIPLDSFSSRAPSLVNTTVHSCKVSWGIFMALLAARRLACLLFSTHSF